MVVFIQSNIKMHTKMLLYKYTSPENAIHTLSDLTLCWSNIDTFNDPFEGKFIYEKTVKDAARIITITLSIGHPIIVNNHDFNYLLDSSPKIKVLKLFRKLRTLITKMYTKVPFRSTSEYFEAENKIYKFLVQTNFMKHMNGEFLEFMNPYSTAESFIKSTAKSTGLLCLSKIKNHPLMWAHYAKEHTGIMFEIDSSKDFFCSKKHTLTKDVSYVQDIPKFSSDTILGINKILFPKENDEMHTLSSFTKSNAWSYEEEVRIMTKKADPNQNIYQINKDIICGIYLGLKTSQEIREQALSLAKKNIPSAFVFETYLNRDNYEIQSREVKP